MSEKPNYDFFFFFHTIKIIATVDEQFKNNSNHSEVCNTLAFLQKLDQNNPEVLWRLAKAIYYVCLQLKSPNTIINNISKGAKQFLFYGRVNNLFL